jgi:hypothetical protein
VDTKRQISIARAAVTGLVAANRRKNEDRDREEEYRRSNDTEGRGHALEDMGYLTREWTSEVRYHLEHDHGAVRDLDLRHPTLYDRTLTGQGRVYFEQGGERDLAYTSTCDFDRRGCIRDGHSPTPVSWLTCGNWPGAASR